VTIVDAKIGPAKFEGLLCLLFKGYILPHYSIELVASLVPAEFSFAHNSINILDILDNQSWPFTIVLLITSAPLFEQRDV
jgi:hypothetical protein